MTRTARSIHKPRGGEILCLYDLRDPEASNRAIEERRAWGEDFTDTHRLDEAHIVVVFRPGAARRLAA